MSSPADIHTDTLPPELQATIGRDFEPVVPLASPWRRTVTTLVPSLAGLAPLMILLARPAMAPPLVSFSGGGISLLEWLVGLGLLWLALREAVPALGLGARRAFLAIVAGVLLQFLLGLASWYDMPSPTPASDALAIGARCSTFVGLLGLPHLAVAIWLAFRALPIRPRWSGALAGAAAGLVADAVWHLACARNDLQHLLLWHVTATVAMALVGAATGSWWGFRTGRRRP